MDNLEDLLKKRDQFEKEVTPILRKLQEIPMVCSKFKTLRPVTFYKPPVRILFCGQTRSGKSRLISSLLSGSRGKKKNLHLCLCPDRGEDSFTNCIWRVRKHRGLHVMMYRFWIMGRKVLLARNFGVKQKIGERKELKILKVCSSAIDVTHDKKVKFAKVTNEFYTEELKEGNRLYEKRVFKMDITTSKPGIVSDCIAFALRGEKYQKKNFGDLFEKVNNFIQRIRKEYDDRNEKQVRFLFYEIIVEHPIEAFKNYEFIDCAGSGELQKYNEVMKKEVKNAHFVVYVTNVSVSSGLGVGVLDELGKLKLDDGGNNLMAEKMVLVGTHIDKRFGDVPSNTDEDEGEFEDLEEHQLNAAIDELKRKMEKDLKRRAITIPIYYCCSVKNRSQQYGKFYDKRFNLLNEFLKSRFKYLMFTLPCNAFLKDMYDEMFKLCRVLMSDMSILLESENTTIEFIRSFCKNSKNGSKILFRKLTDLLEDEKASQTIEDVVCEEDMDPIAVRNELDAKQVLLTRIVGGFEIVAAPLFKELDTTLKTIDNRYANVEFNMEIIKLTFYDKCVLVIQNLSMIKIVSMFFISSKSVWKEALGGRREFQPNKEWRTKTFKEIFPTFKKKLPGFVLSLMTKHFDQFLVDRRNAVLRKEDIQTDRRNGKGFFEDIVKLETELVVCEHRYLNEKKLNFKNDENSLIAEGTYGKVYRGKLRGEKVAIKIEKISDKRVLKMLYKEIHFMNYVRLCGNKEENYSNLIPLLSLEKRDNKHLIVMPLMWGDLKRLVMAESIRFTEREKIQLFKEIAIGLKFLHVRGIFHRDMKPGNVLLNVDSKNVFICDYGFMKMLQLSEKSYAVGSPAYKDPMIHFGINEKYGLKCDVYPLGIIMAQIWENKRHIMGVLKDEIVELYNNNPLYDNRMQLRRFIRRDGKAKVRILKDLTVGGLLGSGLDNVIKRCTCLDERLRLDILGVINELDRLLTDFDK